MPQLRVPIVLLLISFMAACASTQRTTPEISPSPRIINSASIDNHFMALSQRWLDGAMRLSPVYATQMGDHRFDNELDDLSAAGQKRRLLFAKDILADLEKIDRSLLSRETQVDAALLHHQLRYSIWTAETLHSMSWDPTLYSQRAGDALYNLMAREFSPLPERLRAATSRMEKLPTLFSQMRTNLDLNRVPAIHAETVAKQNNGVMSLVDELIVPHISKLRGVDKTRLENAIAALRTAVIEHQEWLDKVLVPNAKGDFRIGQELYDAKLGFELNSPLTRQEIRQRAGAEITRTRKEMYDVSRIILAKNPKPLLESPSSIEQQAAISAALELAYADRPARDQVVTTAKATLQQSTEFVRTENIVSLPASPVDIILMPEFQRGVAIAYCDSPGPLDKNLKAFYAVSPIPNDWSEEQVTSFLREYNTRSIHELTIHEAMPGHYLQLAHSNKNPSVLRAVLGSGTFIEGWAMYAEKVMAEHNYLNGDPLYRLIHLKWYLRSVVNAVLDQAIHVDGMTREQAMTLMMTTAFQEEREAAGKWTRAQLSSAQLATYFVGAQEHFDLRHDAQLRWGETFNEKHYHDTVLSFGSPPVRYARALMFDEAIH